MRSARKETLPQGGQGRRVQVATRGQSGGICAGEVGEARELAIVPSEPRTFRCKGPRAEAWLPCLGDRGVQEFGTECEEYTSGDTPKQEFIY